MDTAGIGIRGLLACALIAASGCEPKAGGGASGTGTGGGASGTGTGGTSGTGTDGTSGTGGISSGGGTGSSSSAGTGGACPEAGVVAISSPTIVVGKETLDCTVVSVGTLEDETIVTMQCDGFPDPVDVSWRSTDHVTPDLQVQASVRLTVIVDDPQAPQNLWFALHDLSGPSERLVAAGVSGTTLDPPNRTLADLLGEADVGVTGMVCPPTADACLDGLAQALELRAAGGDSVTVPTPGIGEAGTSPRFRLVVAQAVTWETLDCVDVPPAYYQLVVERIPGT